ncbi:MAG: hypothetical protein KDD89_00190 [Anaerolineales bacterium]|nr:hypothetical protein [Anaerolineales bacterium]
MTIEFRLDQTEPQTGTLVYLPHGTRSLRLRISTESALPPLRLRPLNNSPADQPAGKFCGYEDGTTAVQANFELSWGGGHEAGPPAKSKDKFKAFEEVTPLEPGDFQVIIMNLTHIGDNLPESATLTLAAVADEKPDEIHATLVVALQRPAGLPAKVQNVVQSEPGKWVVTAGTHLPQYDTRWWPEDDVRYTAVDTPPLTIKLEHDRQTVLHVYWQTDLIARIEDHSQPSILVEDGGVVRFDLFDFDDYYYCLRLWFFWLNVNIGHGFFVGRHEVPDVERFDLLIKKEDGLITLACADLHWRESWGLATETPLRATIGLGRETKLKLAQEQLGGLWAKIWGKKTADYGAKTTAYNPLRYVTKLARREATTDTPMVERAKGTEAHIPMLQNVETGNEKLASSDVRLG